MTSDRTVVVHRWTREATDAHGVATALYTPEPAPVYGWQPGGADAEDVTAHEASVLRRLLLLVPPGFHLDPRDRVEVDGHVYEAVGGVQSYDHGPFGYTPGGTVVLQRTEG